MVRGMTRVMVGAAVVMARTALAAAPVTKRGSRAKAAPDTAEAAEAASEPGEVDDVESLVPAQGDAPVLEEAETSPAPAAAADLVTKADEDPWTEAEVAEVHDELSRRVEELRAELVGLDADLDGLIRSGGEGTGQDSADVGSASSERDQEISLVNNARAMLHQSERALERLAEGSFGVCESCGGAIGKMRVMAFPRATLCLSCKQREERR